MQTILGIDIGTYSVKVAELQRSFKNFAFTGFYERRVQYNDVLTPEESQSAALQALLEDHALTWDTAYAAFPGNAVASRALVLPFSKSSRIEQALPFEIEEHMPFDLEDVIYDYHVLESGKEFSRLLAFYTQKRHVAQVLSLVNSAGVEPRRLCVAGMELVNLIAMGSVPPDAPFAIIDVGHRQTVVSICEQGKFAFSRTLSLGGEDMTQAIAQAVGVSVDEAEQLKIEMGQVVVHGEYPPEDTIPYKVMRAIDSVMGHLLRELKQTFFSYRQQSENVVQGMYLCGGTSRLGSIDDYLSVHLQQNVTRIDCHDFSFTRVERAEASSESAATALAIALRAVAPSGLSSVDLRKDEFVYRANTEHVGGRVRRFMAAGVILCLLATGWFGFRWHTLTNKAEAARQELIEVVAKALPKGEKRPTSPDMAVKTLQSVTKRTRERIESLQALLKPSALNTLQRFSAAVPAREDVNMDVDIFEYTPERTQVKVLAATSPDVDKIQRTLNANLSQAGTEGAAADGGDIMVITYGNSKEVKSRGQEGVLTFQVTMEPKDVADEKAEKKKGKRRRRRRG